jgi:LacI family transcriptional regulator
MLTFMLSRMRRVALIYDATMAYDLQVIGGVAAYLHEENKWNVYIAENTLKDQRLPDFASWEGDGIIANLDDPDVAMAVVKSKLPTVGFGSGYGWYAPESHIPYFFTNNQAIARLAADHLLQRGFRYFAYCGYPRTPTNGWSEEREREFTERVKEHGFPCQIYRGRHRNSRRWAQIQEDLCAWLVSLPKPVGLMGANDNRARQVLEACRVCGLHVPEEIAVIGVDNDEVLCRLSSPLLTSIEQGAERIGYEAAALLDTIMSGKKSAKRRYVIDPVGVETRLSTEVLAVGDPQVAKAMSFIREHACDGIKVPEVVAAVAASRSGLEARFKTALGRTLHTAIRDVQLERAKSLVSETNLPPKEIAASTGFKSVQHMSSLFRQAVGLPPAEYRRMLRAGLFLPSTRALATTNSN